IPEGQSDGPISSGRLRSLEEQLSRAKQKIHSFQRLSGDVGPGREQEELRRKVENGVKELWYFIHSEIQKLSHAEPSDRLKHTETLLQDLGHQQRSDTYSEAHDRDVQVVELPIVDSLHPRPPYLPLAIPEDLAPRLQRLHGDPSVWWVSQFVKYLVRPQAWLEKEIQETCGKLGFKHPIIGVHVRRTDKVGTEAAFHPIEEYMVHVEEQFQYMAQRGHVDKKRVYLATDDPALLQEAKTKYTDYEFISDNSISWSASLHNRYTENSLRGVCRVAYEIMQTLHPDASAFFRSLDDIYYFGGQNAHNQIAIYPHQARTAEDIPLEPGDVIGVAGNHWDGYSKGVNRKLGRTGLYPSYKVKEKIETVKYPTYPEADKLLSL
ncbi:hypothetical protein cypCar_00006687, partial [Cyprinus carpio]